MIIRHYTGGNDYMKKKRRRFIPSWYDDHKEKYYKQVDEKAVKDLLTNFKKYGQVYSVMQYINFETLRMAYYSTTIVENENGKIYQSDKERATGIDGITKQQYGKELSKNLERLLYRMKKHSYKMKTVLRTYIPKEPKMKIINGKETMIISERPLSIPCVEDSILQSTIVNQILVPITEEIFTDESFGYRPDKGVKDAIRYIEDINYYYDIKYALVLDNKSFFDSINKEYLIDMVGSIIKDKVFIGLMKTILRTGYLDSKDNETKIPSKGIYQGTNISPVLANLYLHNVIDTWYQTIKTKGKIFMVRYADDIVILGSNEDDIDNVLVNIKDRFNKYDLEIAKDKTNKINLEEEDLTYLGYRLHKSGKVICKYIADKKIISIKLRIDSIISDSLTDIKEVEVSKYVRNIMDYGRYLRDYIREINNLLCGIYRTYRYVDNPLVLDMLYDYACNEIRKHWSYSLSETNLEYMIEHIIPPKI